MLCFWSTACGTTGQTTSAAPLMHTTFEQPVKQTTPILTIDSPQMEEDVDDLKVTVKGKATPGQLVEVLIFSDQNEEVSFKGNVRVNKLGTWVLQTSLKYSADAFDEEDNMRIFYTIRAQTKDHTGKTFKTSTYFAFKEEETGC